MGNFLFLKIFTGKRPKYTLLENWNLSKKNKSEIIIFGYGFLKSAKSNILFKSFWELNFKEGNVFSAISYKLLSKAKTLNLNPSSYFKCKKYFVNFWNSVSKNSRFKLLSR